MKTDAIKFKILEDGTISLTTDAVSGENHVSADELLAQLTNVLGGQRVTKKRSKLSVGINLHDHSHSHHHHHH
jgi:hypothetical protein